MNAFLLPGDFERVEPFRRFYARIDEIESGDDQPQYTFSLVDAEWVDDLGGIEVGAHLNVSLFERMPIAILRIEHGYGPFRYPYSIERLFLWPGFDRYNIEFYYGWFEINLERGYGAMLYQNLFDSEGISVLAKITYLSQTKLASKLNHLFSTSHFSTASSAALLKQRLGKIKPVDRALVLDVGQGSAVALIEEGEHEAAFFFDFGRSVTMHTPTFPSGFKPVCRKPDSFVLVSHWDWDHWALGSKLPGALTMDWFFPYEATLSPVHAAFANFLHGLGRLHMLPNSFNYASIGNVTVDRCTGSTRNGSGYALTVASPVQGARCSDRWLFPADALYAEVPGAAGASYSAVVVPHHGARLGQFAVPAPLFGGQRAIISVGGPTNYYHHPVLDTMTAHSGKSWNVVLTRDRISPIAPQHYGLDFSGGPNSWAPCGAAPCAFHDAH